MCGADRRADSGVRALNLDPSLRARRSVGAGVMSLHVRQWDMDLAETVAYLSDELDIEQSSHVREAGRRVAHLRD